MIDEPELKRILQAICAADLSTIRQVLNSSSTSWIERNGRSLIDKAVLHNKPKVIDLLAEYGIKASGLDLLRSIQDHNYEIYPFLLNKYINLQEVDADGANIMHHLALIWGAYVYGLSCIEPSENRNYASIDENYASIRKFWEFWIEETVRRGANINARDKCGNTPLHQASEQSSYDLTELYLRLGAIPEIGNIDGDTPMHGLFDEKCFNSMEPLLRYTHNANIRNNDGETPLHELMRYGLGLVSPLFIKMMISYGADITMRNIENYDALALVALRKIATYDERYLRERENREQQHQLGFIQVLLDAGADPDAVVGIEQRPMREILLENKNAVYNPEVIAFFKNDR